MPLDNSTLERKRNRSPFDLTQDGAGEDTRDIDELSLPLGRDRTTHRTADIATDGNCASAQSRHVHEREVGSRAESVRDPTVVTLYEDILLPSIKETKRKNLRVLDSLHVGESLHSVGDLRIFFENIMTSERHKISQKVEDRCIVE